jgi:hypothetical protein
MMLVNATAWFWLLLPFGALPTDVPTIAGGQGPTAVRPAQARPATTLFARNMTRLESWRFFEPRAGGGDPHSTFIGNRLLFGIRHSTPRWEAHAAGQYVQFGGLPERAVGPGPLGTGAAYFDASADTSSRGVYLKTLNLTLKSLTPGLDLQLGRFGYASGAEAPSGQPKIEAVKRQRVDSRLIGEFEWSLYQRSFDGVRADWRGRGLQLTAAAFRPTQGGFEEDAGRHIPELNVILGALSAGPGRWLPRTDTQLFVYHYRDRRDVQSRPDNSGLTAARADIGVTTFGGTLVAAVPAGAGQIDALAWGAGQTGDWYREDHRAWTLALEGGYQWTAVRWNPWVRGGISLASGDDDPADGSHRTFFQMLPTARKYALSTVYTQMNLRDTFAQVLLRPRPALAVRVDVHQLDLMDTADRWYFGSGVTQRRGAGFGYGTRLSNGATRLGRIVEGALDCTITRHWSVNAYGGIMRGGAVVTGLFAGERLTFAYVENVLQF